MPSILPGRLVEGAFHYDLDTRRHDASGTGSVTVLPPGVVHNGYPAEYEGQFRKRELYLDRDFLPASLVGPAVDASTFSDPALGRALSRLHDRLVLPEPLEIETGARAGRRTDPEPAAATIAGCGRTRAGTS